jgi:hypothetical protein
MAEAVATGRSDHGHEIGEEVSVSRSHERLYRLLHAVLGAAFAALVGGCSRESATSSAPIARTDHNDVSGVLFRDVAALSGINFAYHNGEEAGNFAILEELGGGLAAFDFDGDGRLDLFITGGGLFTGPDKKQIKGLPCKLYRNLADPTVAAGFRFEDVTTQAGLNSIDFYSHGAAVADFDNDGWPDLLVTGWHRLALFHNEPVDPADPAKGRKFVDVTKQAGLPTGLWTTSAAWGDLDGDDYPDLYVCQYVDWSFEHNHPTNCRVDETCTQRDVCSPQFFGGLEHKLFRNRGDGTFEDVSKAAGLRVARTEAEYKQLDWMDTAARERLRQMSTRADGKCGKGLGVLLVDINADGKPDVYVANDTVDKFLYRNRSLKGKPRFEEIGLIAGVARDNRGQPNGSMGLDVADYDGSGRPSLWVTNWLGELSALYQNQTRPRGVECFFYASENCGVASIGLATAGWGTGFLDLDHHGWEDLVLVAGDAYRHNPKAPRAQRPVLFRNEGAGRFRDITAYGGPYFQSDHIGRGLVLADFDNDGRIDIAVSHLNQPVALLHNEADTAGRHWLGLELKGSGHRDVVGARVMMEAEGRTQTRFAKGGGSYLSSGDRRMVFGLGRCERVDRVTVMWPGNRGTQEWSGDRFTVDQYWTLHEGQEAVSGPQARASGH